MGELGATQTPLPTPGWDTAPGSAGAAPLGPGTPAPCPKLLSLACPSLRLLAATFQLPRANRTGHSTQQHHPAIVLRDPGRAALCPQGWSRDKLPAGCPWPAWHCSRVHAPLQAVSLPLAAPTGSLAWFGLSAGARGAQTLQMQRGTSQAPQGTVFAASPPLGHSRCVGWRSGFIAGDAVPASRGCSDPKPAEPSPAGALGSQSHQLTLAALTQAGRS